MDLAFVVDCEEMYLQERLLRRGRDDDNVNAIAARIQFYKQRTLPAIKHFDDQGKLHVVRIASISIVLMGGLGKVVSNRKWIH